MAARAEQPQLFTLQGDDTPQSRLIALSNAVRLAPLLTGFSLGGDACACDACGEVFLPRVGAAFLPLMLSTSNRSCMGNQNRLCKDKERGQCGRAKSGNQTSCPFRLPSNNERGSNLLAHCGLMFLPSG
jgi:hypothetical protein